VRNYCNQLVDRNDRLLVQLVQVLLYLAVMSLLRELNHLSAEDSKDGVRSQDDSLGEPGDVPPRSRCNSGDEIGETRQLGVGLACSILGWSR
jgi:hypothetical protein